MPLWITDRKLHGFWSSMAATVDEDQIFISNCELQYHTRVPTTSGYKSEVSHDSLRGFNRLLEKLM